MIGWRSKAGCAIALCLVLAACASGESEVDSSGTQDEPSTSQNWTETGFWPYDYGYGYGTLMNGTASPGSVQAHCESGAQALINSGALWDQPQVDAYLSGCSDGAFVLAPNHVPLGEYGPPPGNGAAPGPAPAAGGDCDPNYDGACVPLVSYDLDCPDIQGPVYVVGVDVHKFDRDENGVGCEPYP